ncbi:MULTISPECIES: FAD-binding oxidoreductase [unclassified Pseudofrankia]|uniref:FAD-binding oxidoreductase n=1 Tax=unclassified Pseudofrankia TaxID=2994372 RepID=UPI000ACBB225|nr:MULTISPECIES: FAD-binding oxidoreductase [unclassified Pseudofrankia]MDT3438769.1 FAD-binding oxidoreductase [Pseudofrankia sp. BMG5.37]
MTESRNPPDSLRQRQASPPSGGPEQADDAGDLAWWGWGSPDERVELPGAVRALLVDGLGFAERPSPPVDLGAVELPPSGLPGPARGDLAAIVGAEHVRDDREIRIRHCRGRSTTDLLALRAGDASAAPDAVLTPASHDEVAALLAACAEHRVAVVPFGGGTSVVGGLAPRRAGFAAVVALDLRRMNRLLDVDRASLTATLEPGLRGPAAEALLAEHGLTIGHVPQSWEYATIGGFAATRSSGQASSGYGRFDAVVVGLRVATPLGGWELGRAPASAAGPDLRQLVLGSEGAFGVITEVRVRVRPLPARRRYEGWRVDTFAAGLDLMRELAQRDLLPAVARLSDELETAAGAATPHGAGEPTGEGADGADGGSGCYVVLGYEGEPERVRRQAADLAELLSARAARPLGTEVGDDWVRGRFHGPRLRDALLDAGMFAETLETATFWSGLSGLYAGVRGALAEVYAAAGVPAVVLCHVSHLYPTGASLYFTLVAGHSDDRVGLWATAKAAASDAIVAAGGTITHHHAVGTDHRPWLGAEIGDVGVAVLRAVKQTLDPAGILNPGVLVPERTASAQRPAAEGLGASRTSQQTSPIGSADRTGTPGSASSTNPAGTPAESIG